MANPYFERYGQKQNHQNGSNGSQMDFISALAQLKSKGGDPNQMIQQLLSSGKVTQEQYNAAVAKAQQLQTIFNK